jgi:hypothetical protein
MKRAARNEKNAALGAQRVKVTVAQAAPVAFDRKSTLKKAHVPAGEAAHRREQRAILDRDKKDVF